MSFHPRKFLAFVAVPFLNSFDSFMAIPLIGYIRKTDGDVDYTIWAAIVNSNPNLRQEPRKIQASEHEEEQILPPSEIAVSLMNREGIVGRFFFDEDKNEIAVFSDQENLGFVIGTATEYAEVLLAQFQKFDGHR